MDGIARRHAARLLASTIMVASLAACVATPPPPAPRNYSLSADVLFPFGSATLRPSAMAALDQTLGQIRATFPNPVILVVGHTDAIGSDTANDALSLRRADAVRTWLISAGLPPAAVTTEGHGKREPVAPDMMPNGADNPAGRAQNRRVELVARPA